MIELFEKERRTLNRRSSKGNQLKFERDGIWYKADYLGYEGLAEYTVSKLLACSTLRESEYVAYEPEEILYNGQVFRGCKSRDFTEGWQLITLERLFQQTCGKGLNSTIHCLENHTDRLKMLADQAERITGIRGFRVYLQKMLTIDTLFLNEDRHTHNIAVMTNERHEYRLAPFFDHGACLLSDTMLDYPLNQDCLQLLHKAKPKTFCQDFEEQMDISEELYGNQLKFNFGYNEVKAIVDRADMYPPEIRQRVTDLVMARRRSYEYLFL